MIIYQQRQRFEKWLVGLVLIGIFFSLVFFKDSIVEKALTTFYRITVTPKINLRIDVSFTDWQTMIEDKNKAQQNQAVLVSDDQLIPITLRTEIDNLRADFRLTRDFINQKHEGKWPYKVEMRPLNSFMGMSRFLLVPPKSNDFLDKWVLNQAMEDQDLVGLKMELVNLIINGERIGVYAIEEHFTKEPIERAKRREGVIFRVLDNLNFEAFQLVNVQKNPELNQQYIDGLKKLNDFNNDLLPAEQVFDVDVWAQYVALLDAFGGQTGLFDDNLRLYYNPVTGWFEPIAYVDQAGEEINDLSINLNQELFLNKLLENQEFRYQYFKKLNDYNVSSLIKTLKPEIRYYQRLIRQDNPSYAFDQKKYQTNLDVIKEKLAQINIKTSETEISSYEYDGFYTIDQTIVVPKNSWLVIKPGSQINLVNGGGILSYSPVEILGTETRPVKIYSSDGLGQGLMVIKTEKESKIEFAEFSNLNEFKTMGMRGLGGVNFYEADVSIVKSQLINSQGEDGINIIRSKFKINNSSFKQINSDAVDIDFGEGKVVGCKISQTINDGLDFSGSNATVDQVEIDFAGDKGISVGENSQVEILKTKIANSRLGVASKDLSIVKLSQVGLKNLEAGLAAYQKKPEFGVGKIEANNLEVFNVEDLYVIEIGSKLILDGRSIIGKHKNLAKRFL